MGKHKKLIAVVVVIILIIAAAVGMAVKKTNDENQEYSVDDNYTSYQNSTTDDDTNIKNEDTSEGIYADAQKDTEDEKIEIKKIEDEIIEDEITEEDSEKAEEENTDENIEKPQKANNSSQEDENSKDENSEDEYTGYNWVDEKINNHIDEINDFDLEGGLSIGDKIDDDIILGYLDSDMTSEDKESLLAYLEIVLSEEEYNELKILFSKYDYIFEEDN